MQLWAKEREERDRENLRLSQLLAQQQKEKEDKDNKEREANEFAKKDLESLQEDIAETQQLQATMRKLGLRAGVNPPPSHSPAPFLSPLPPLSLTQSQKVAPEYLPPENSRKIFFSLRPDIDMNWTKKADRSNECLLRPFTVDLKVYRDVEELVGEKIGERGVLALAGEFVRGACSNIIILDLSRYETNSLHRPTNSRCQIKSRGFSRLLHGLRMGRIINLHTLKLRGNSLCPSAMDYLKVGKNHSDDCLIF
jgi:hypothetical protein